MTERPAVSRVLRRGWHVLASDYGQETNQFTEDDAEFSDLGRRGVYAAAVHVLGAFRVEDFLDEIESRGQEAGCASQTAEGGCPYMNRKKAAPFWGRLVKEARWWAMSGKAMEVAIPRGTALREMFKRSDSEGHCFEVAASLLP
ncbi:MAG: hypothetical protein WAN65_03135 [Candidatus Sulfotelmatobacter sp.]